MGTDNLSRAVSKAFWELVHQSIQQELRDTQLLQKKKETEWTTRFPQKHWMSRQDLLSLGRHSILGKVSQFNQSMSPTELEDTLIEKVWDRIGTYVIDTLYVGAAENADPDYFKINCENLLGAWVSHALPQVATEVAQLALMDEFHSAIDFEDPDGVYTTMKAVVKTGCLERIDWDSRSQAKLQHIQELTLRDDHIPNKQAWSETIVFMLRRLDAEQMRVTDELAERAGPSFTSRWLWWQYTTPENRAHTATVSELSSYFASNTPAAPGLDMEDVKALQHTLERKRGQIVTVDFIHETYQMLYKQHFLDMAIQSAVHCKNRFGYPQEDNKPVNCLQCSDVMLFWRINKMLASTGNILRLEAMEFKKHVEETVRITLDETLENHENKRDLIAGERVTLAEEIEVIRLMQAKLEAFVNAMEDECKV